MSSSTQQFTLRTSSNVKTVHLLGSWDNYTGQLPLSRDSSKPGSWKGNFRFQSSTLVPGKRYWYYYIMDGYHVSHDPAKPSTQEPTTGRMLNILDAPRGGGGGAAAAAAAPRRPTVEIPTGRGLSPSRIAHPKPSKPYASRGIREADYSVSPVDDLASHLEQATLYSPYSASPPSSVGSGSSISSRSSINSSPSSLSSLSGRSSASSSSSSSSSSSCRCNRYGITRRGDKVLLDCGGSRCGYSDDSSSACSSSGSDESESEEEAPRGKVRPRYVEVRPRASAATAAAASSRSRRR